MATSASPCDIMVRGAGIFGLSIAWACVKRGARVRLIDPAGPGAGASGGVVGALAPHVPENWNPKKQFQLESLLMAADFWSEVHSTGGVDPGYARTGRLQPIPDTTARARALARGETARALWQDHATWTVQTPTPDWHPLSATGEVIFDTLSAHLHPRRACAALVAALAAHGVHCEPDAPQMAPTLWATGVRGFDALNAAAARPLGTGVKGQAALLALNMVGAPQIFTDGLHIIPHTDGTTAIGSTSENTFEHTGPDHLIDHIVTRARAAVPALRDAPVIEHWAGIRPRARSRAPMLGHWPDHPGHFIANGGFKIAFGMAPKIAEVMADLVLENRDTIPPEFRVNASA